MSGLNLPRSQMFDILIRMITENGEVFRMMLVSELPDEFARLTPDESDDVAADTLQRIVAELCALKS